MWRFVFELTSNGINEDLVYCDASSSTSGRFCQFNRMGNILGSFRIDIIPTELDCAETKCYSSAYSEQPKLCKKPIRFDINIVNLSPNESEVVLDDYGTTKTEGILICGDVDCFISAAAKCSPAKWVRGINDFFEIKRMAYGRCVIYKRITDRECSLEINDLVSILGRWKIGNYSENDLNKCDYEQVFEYVSTDWKPCNRSEWFCNEWGCAEGGGELVGGLNISSLEEYGLGTDSELASEFYSRDHNVYSNWDSNWVWSESNYPILSWQ